MWVSALIEREPPSPTVDRRSADSRPMNKSAQFILLLAVALSTIPLTGCGGRGGAAPLIDIEGYEQAMVRFPGSPDAIDEGIARFQSTFEDLTAPDVGPRFQQTYAETFFFNDTLHSISERASLVDYMERTGAALSESQVIVHQVIREQADVYVRWTMEFKTRAAGRDIHSKSIGVTHLRFDESGQVVLHQDFWDSGHALYAHIPFVGFAVKRARNSM